MNLSILLYLNFFNYVYIFIAITIYHGLRTSCCLLDHYMFILDHKPKKLLSIYLNFIKC